MVIWSHLSLRQQLFQVKLITGQEPMLELKSPNSFQLRTRLSSQTEENTPIKLSFLPQVSITKAQTLRDYLKWKVLMKSKMSTPILLKTDQELIETTITDGTIHAVIWSTICQRLHARVRMFSTHFTTSHSWELIDKLAEPTLMPESKFGPQMTAFYHSHTQMKSLLMSATREELMLC